MSLKPMLIYYNNHDHHDTNNHDHHEANNHGHPDKNQPSLLVAGVGRGREESSMLTAIKEAARR